MPPRKRKATPATTTADDAVATTVPIAVVAVKPKRSCNLVHGVVKNAQVNEAFHTKYIKELQHIYAKVGHDEFVTDYRRVIQQLMVRDENQPFANVGLKFLAKFATSYNTEDTHPLLSYTFGWLLETVSSSPVIRFRICQFVNLLLNALSNDAALDDSICDNILKYMFERMKDVSATVRVQALNAMQRLQMPDNTNDPIVKTYQHHLNADPSPLVRQAVITSIGRNLHTIPFILDRLWDVDDKVRRHAYLHMCTYSVKSYKVVQRLQFIEQGLNDHSESVRKVVTNVLIPAWLESYNRDYIQFVAALKLDASEADIERFRTAARLVLVEIFKKHRFDELIAVLPLHNADSEAGAELNKCIPIDRLSVESSLYWLALIEFVSADEDRDDDLERILPELSTFCRYMNKYFEMTNAEQMDKWQKLEHHYVLLTLCEIIGTYDMSDELGRCNLKSLLCAMLAREEFDETIVAKIVLCLERVVPDADERLQLVADIIRTVVDAHSAPLDLSSAAVVELLGGDQNLNFKVSSMKVRIMDLEEQERDSITQKEYGRAEKLREELNECSEELAALIAQHLHGGTEGDLLPQPRRVSNQETTRCIQMAYHVVRSPSVRSLNPSIVKVFKDFIRRQMECQQMYIRDHALKCAISFAMLYEQLAKDVYSELFAQFFKHQNSRIWATAISGMFELIDRYGFEHFEEAASENGAESETGTVTTATSSSTAAAGAAATPRKSKSKTNTRQLYNTETDTQTDGDDDDLLMRRRNTDIMFVLDHFLDDCAEPFIQQALIDGYCRLLLRSHISGANYVSRMLLKYFNPLTEPEITQILGIFFEKLIAHQRQECLQEAMLTTLCTVLESPPDSPLQEIQPESILRFVITSTQPLSCSPGLNIHNTIAMSFVDVMTDNADNKELLRLLAKALITLDVADDAGLRRDLLCGLDRLLDGPQLESRTEAGLRQFKDKLQLADASSTATTTAVFSSTANAQDVSSAAVAADASDADEATGLADDDDATPLAERSIDEAVVDAAAVDGNNGTAMSSPAKSNTSSTADRTITSPVIRSPNSLRSPPRSVRMPLSPRPIPSSASQDNMTAEPATPVMPTSSQTTYGLQNSTRGRSLRKSQHVVPPQQQPPRTPTSRTPTSRTTVEKQKAIAENGIDENATVNMSPSDNDESGAIESTPPAPTPVRKKKIAPQPTTHRTRRAAAALAGSSVSESTKVVERAIRGKRRNDKVAKSPSPRSSLATVSKQTSKRSRTNVSPGTKAALATASAAAATPITGRQFSSRRSLEGIKNVSVLMSPNHTRIIDERLDAEKNLVVAQSLPNSSPKRTSTRRSMERTPKAGVRPASTRSSSSSSPTKAKSVVASPSASRASARPSVSSSSVDGNTSSSSGPPAKIPARSASAKPRTGATARSALPLRSVASSRPSKQPPVPPSTASAAPSVKYPQVKRHRLVSGSSSTSANAAAVVVAAVERQRTRGATVQQFIDTNIITRNRRSIENVRALTTQLDRRSSAGSSAVSATVSRAPAKTAATVTEPLRSSNGLLVARQAAATKVVNPATVTVPRTTQRSTRIPRPTKK